MNLKDFSLLKESDTEYHIGHPRGKSMTIPKRGLSNMAQKLISTLKREQHFAEGTPDGTEEEAAPDAAPEEVEAPNATSAQDTPEQIASDASAGAPAQQEGSMLAAETQGEGQAQSDQPQAAPEQPEAQAAPFGNAGVQQAKESLQKGANAEAQAGKEQARAYKEAAQGIGELKSSTDIQQEGTAKDAAFQKQLADQKIDPNHYLAGRSTGTRITQAIATLIGGLGSGITGTNPAAEFIKDAINKDIETQKNEQGKTLNMWKMSRDATGSELQANLQEQNRLMSIAKVKALQAQSQALGPQAQARLAQGIMALDQQMAKNNWINGKLGGGPAGTEQQHISEMEAMAQVNPAYKKEMEAKYIPGLGVARIPPSPDQRKELTSYDSLGKRLDEAIHFQNTEAGSLGTFTGSAANAKADNIRNSIAAELNKLYGLNRLTEIEYHNFLSQIPSPGSFFSQRSLSKLNDLKGQLEDRKASVVKNLGVTPFKNSPSPAVAQAWANDRLRQNPQDPVALRVAGIAQQQLQNSPAQQVAGRR